MAWHKQRGRPSKFKGHADVCLTMQNRSSSSYCLFLFFFCFVLLVFFFTPPPLWSVLFLACCFSCSRWPRRGVLMDTHLCGVCMQEDVVEGRVFANGRENVGNRLEHAGFVICKHDGDQAGVVGYGPENVLGVDGERVTVGCDARDSGQAALFQVLEQFFHGIMFDVAGHNVWDGVASVVVFYSESKLLQCRHHHHVVSLCAAAREHNLVCRCTNCICTVLSAFGNNLKQARDKE